MPGPLSIPNVGGHPKDVVLYAGGTMAQHAARGDRVCMLTPTTGLSHHLKAIESYRDTGEQPDMDELVEERREELVAAAHDRGAWVHVDGAFGLWALANRTRQHLVSGLHRADSLATDGHKWLNVTHAFG